MKICLCYDGSAESGYAADHLKRSLHPEDTVELFSVVRKSKDAEKQAARAEAMKAQMQNIIDEWRAAGVGPKLASISVEFNKDSRATILDHVEGNFDMVVLGARGLGAIKRALLGSTSATILNSAQKTAVYVVPSQVLSAENIYLLAVDGSEPSQRATAHLATLVKPEDKVHVLSLYLHPGESGVDSGYDMFETVRSASKLKAETIVKEAAQIIMAAVPGLPNDNITASVVETTNIKEGLVEYAQIKAKFTCIVMGSRGLTKLQRAYIGSNTNYALNHSGHPLMVVH